MSDNDKKIEPRSGSIDEIFSRKPGWILRWGSTLLLVISILLLVFSSQIKCRESFSFGVAMEKDSLSGGYYGMLKLPSYTDPAKLFSEKALLSTGRDGMKERKECEVFVSFRQIGGSTADSLLDYEFIIESLPQNGSYLTGSGDGLINGILNIELAGMSLLERVVKPVR